MTHIVVEEVVLFIRIVYDLINSPKACIYHT